MVVIQSRESQIEGGLVFSQVDMNVPNEIRGSHLSPAIPRAPRKRLRQAILLKGILIFAEKEIHVTGVPRLLYRQFIIPRCL